MSEKSSKSLVYYFFCFRYCGNEKKVVTLQPLCVAADEEL